MRTNMRYVALGLLAAGALLVASNANAACPSIIFGQTAGLLQTPSNSTASVRSNFWVLNGGNPAIGQGNDNGSTADGDSATAWIRPYQGSLYVTGDWSQSTGYDGCPDPTPIPQQRMVFSFSDVDAGGNTVFAVSCMQRQPLVTNQFEIETTTGGGPLVLTAAPKAAITNTVRTGNE